MTTVGWHSPCGRSAFLTVGSARSSNRSRRGFVSRFPDAGSDRRNQDRSHPQGRVTQMAGIRDDPGVPAAVMPQCKRRNTHKKHAGEPCVILRRKVRFDRRQPHGLCSLRLFHRAVSSYTGKRRGALATIRRMARFGVRHGRLLGDRTVVTWRARTHCAM